MEVTLAVRLAAGLTLLSGLTLAGCVIALGYYIDKGKEPDPLVKPIQISFVLLVIGGLWYNHIS